MGPAHREVAGKDLAEALIELGLDELNESSWDVLLYCRLCSEAGVDHVCCFEEICDLKHCRVVLLGA